jgi:hypothetical protein
VPAAETVVAVTPAVTVTFPKARLVVGVILPLPENVALLPALSVRPPVAETVNASPKLTLEPETVVNTGTYVPEVNEYAPLKFIVPAPLIASVPTLMVRAEENVTDPVATVI